MCVTMYHNWLVSIIYIVFKRKIKKQGHSTSLIIKMKIFCIQVKLIYFIHRQVS